MRNARVWQCVLGMARVVIERVGFDEDADAVVVSVRARKRARQRCGRCGRRAAGYDRGEGRAVAVGGISMSASCGVGSRPTPRG